MMNPPSLCQADVDGITVIARGEPGETRAMTQARAWAIARSIPAFTASTGGSSPSLFDRVSCEAEARRRVLSEHLGCSYDISLWNQ